VQTTLLNVQWLQQRDARVALPSQFVKPFEVQLLGLQVHKDPSRLQCRAAPLCVNSIP